MPGEFEEGAILPDIRIDNPDRRPRRRPEPVQPPRRCVPLEGRNPLGRFAESTFKQFLQGWFWHRRAHGPRAGVPGPGTPRASQLLRLAVTGIITVPEGHTTMRTIAHPTRDCQGEGCETELTLRSTTDISEAYLAAILASIRSASTQAIVKPSARRTTCRPGEAWNGRVTNVPSRAHDGSLPPATDGSASDTESPSLWRSCARHGFAPRPA